MGLAWTALGGSTLYVETAVSKPSGGVDGEEKEEGRLVSTGQLGDVMKESTQIAYTYAKVGWMYVYVLSKGEIIAMEMPILSCTTGKADFTDQG